MELRDMGELAGPVLVFGGPYSNLPALRALLWKASTLGIGPEAMICTGDVVAYCAEPAECVALVRSEGIAVVAGNCERQLAAGAADCGCGFAAGTACDLLSAGWYPFADARIGADDRRWMAGLPDVVTFGHGGRRYAVIHGGVSDISRFVWSTSPDADLRAEIALVRDVAGPVDAVIAGHSGIGFARRVDGVDWINAGVIGMPPNDGGAATEYLVLGPDGPGFHRLSYEAETARAAMVRAGLTQGYHDALVTGFWPSEDVLPRDLRRRAA